MNTADNNFDPKKTSKAAKIIIFAALLFISAWVFCSASLRFFLLEHPGLIAVFIGVAGEVWFDWREESGKHARWKKFFMALLVVGLAYELFEAAESDKKAADAIKLAGQANERASINAIQVELLQSNNIVLEEKLMPRIIDSKKIKDFIFLTENIPKITIKIHASPYGDDTIGFAIGIRDLFDSAKFKRDSSENGIDLDAASSGKPITYFVRKIGSNIEMPWVYFVQYGTNDLIYLNANIPTETTNGFERPIVADKNPKAVYEAIFNCFIQLGIKSKWVSNSQLVAPGEFEIYIMPKGS